MKFGLGHRLETAIATGFSPLVLAPVAWYDASQLALTNGDPISTLPDLSGNGHDMTSSGTARATFNATGINGRGTADSDAVDDGMISDSVGALTTWWAFMVVRPISTGSNLVFWALDDYIPDSAWKLIDTGGGNQAQLRSNSGTIAATMAAASNQSVLIEASAVSATVLVGTGATSTGAANYSKAAAVMRLFRRGDGQYNACRFGEGVLGSGVLTAGQRQQLFAYANAKWGTPIP